MVWVVIDGDGWAHSCESGLVYIEEGDQFDTFEEAREEADRLDLKYDTDDWYQVLQLTTASA